MMQEGYMQLHDEKKTKQTKQSSIYPRNFTYKPGPLLFWQFNSN